MAMIIFTAVKPSINQPSYELSKYFLRLGSESGYSVTPVIFSIRYDSFENVGRNVLAFENSPGQSVP